MQTAWIVGAASDPIVRRLPVALTQRGWRAKAVAPEQLSDLSIAVDEEHCAIDGERVSALVFRAATNAPFSASFAPEDHAFADAETRAVWLAAMNLPSVVSINRLDALAWFETEHWTIWRRRLLSAGVPLAPATYGGARHEGDRVWLPFSVCQPQPSIGDAVARAGGAAHLGAQRFDRHVVVCGEVVSGPGARSVDQAARALAACGVVLAELATDEQHRIAWVDTQPRELSDPASDRAVALLAQHIAEQAS